jgi:hypothetical protein
VCCSTAEVAVEVGLRLRAERTPGDLRGLAAAQSIRMIDRRLGGSALDDLEAGERQWGADSRIALWWPKERHDGGPTPQDGHARHLLLVSLLPLRRAVGGDLQQLPQDPDDS